MTVTESQAQALIIATVGDVDPATGVPPTVPTSGILAMNMPVLWESYAALEAVASGLQRLAVERHAYRLVLSVIRRQVDLKSGGDELKRSQQAQFIEDTLKTLDAQIEALQRSYGSGAAVSGEITRTAPVTPADVLTVPVFPDANSPAYNGSPYWPGPRRW